MKCSPSAVCMMGCCCCKGQEADTIKLGKTNRQSSPTTPTNEPNGTEDKKDNNGCEPPPPSPPIDEPVTPGQAPLYVAKYDYDARTDEDLGFKKGELLYILDDSEGNWWKARSKASNKEGYVPNNYIAPVKTLDAHE